MRKPFIAANWKMHKTIAETQAFLSIFIPLIKDVKDVTVVVAPPFTSLATVAEQVKNTNIVLAAQNMFFEEKGAYTGEISPMMLVDAGCSYVIIGHSERRQYFLETDEVVNRKIKAAQKHDLGVIVCIGESLVEREADKTYEILQRQLEGGLNDISPADMVIAYEPVWAIGTGKTAAPEQAQEAHAFIRETLRSFYGKRADELCILYGGSVTPENVNSLMDCSDIDGALVGGASLKAESFAGIVQYRKKS
jgi:triosephosphate isomerase